MPGGADNLSRQCPSRLAEFSQNSTLVTFFNNAFFSCVQFDYNARGSDLTRANKKSLRLFGLNLLQWSAMLKRHFTVFSHPIEDSDKPALSKSFENNPHALSRIWLGLS